MLALQNKHQLVAMWIVYVCGRRILCRTFCLQMGGLRPPQPPRFLEAIDACKKEQASSCRHHRCWRLALKTSIWSSPCGSFMFALGKGCADHFVCKWGGAALPPNPPAFKGHRCLQQRTSVKSSPPSLLAAGATNQHLVIAMWTFYVCTRGRLCGSFCLQMGGGCAPPNPLAFKGHRCLH